MSLKVKASSQLVTKVTSFEIKGQYQTFRFSKLYISQYIIYSINLYPQITRVGSPSLMNWGLPDHVTGAQDLRWWWQPTSHQIRKCCLVFNVHTNIYEAVFKHRQGRASQSHCTKARPEEDACLPKTKAEAKFCKATVVHISQLYS